MSGHSKWSTIKRKKGALDAKRGKLFARHIRAIESAARTGGADPEANPTLATAIQNAKDDSMPKDNIERALRRAAGKEGGGVEYEHASFEGYAAGGVALLIECLTDNRNRASNDVKGAFNKHGGNLAEPGAVSYLFNRTGQVLVPTEGVEEDDILMAGLEAGEAGITEVLAEGDQYTVLCDPKDTVPVRRALEDAGVPVNSSDVTMRPTVTVPITEESDAKRVLKLVDTLEDLDDVQSVYANFDIPDRVLETVV